MSDLILPKQEGGQKELTPLATFTVTNTNDLGTGSLRQAILDANASPGTDTITFSIGSGGVQTIGLVSGLPTITDPVIIDGTTQPGFAGKPIIELNGANAGANTHGISLSAGNSTIKGLVINRFRDGIRIQAAGGNSIQGNYIGTDVNGSVALSNSAFGVELIDVSNNTIGGTVVGTGNVISASGFSNVSISGNGATGNTVAANFIGTNAAGTAALGGSGIDLGNGANNNTIGGTTAAARNIISGSAAHGVGLGGGDNNVATNNRIQGNYIGLNAAGTATINNAFSGVILQGTGATNNTIGGTAAGAGNVIAGNGHQDVAILQGASGNTVQGNFLGTDATGNVALGGGGVFIGASNNNLIGGTVAGARNVISGNTGSGININTNATGNIVQGNYVGTNAAGTAAVANNDGIFLNGVSGNFIGGTAAGAGNVISGNTNPGIQISNGSSGNFVQGNFIGTNAAGSSALPNGAFGVTISSPNNTIGGTSAGARNIISGNTGVAAQGTGHGLMINGANATGNLVQGNYIGTDVTGSFAVPNVRSGIFIFNSASSNTIGGAPAGARNVISGNSVRSFNGNLDLAGIDIQASGNTVSGNYLGTNAAGTAPIANGAGLSVSGSNNVATSNLISGNTQNGVSISNGNGNSILSNTIFGNGARGIILQGAANNNQAPPVITSVSSSGGFITITGTATGPPNTNGTVQFFANDACDPSGSGEGQIFLGSNTAQFGANGSTPANGVTTLPGTLAPGQVVTATTTDANNNTSAFSVCRAVTTSSFNISGHVLDGSGNAIAGLAVDLNGTVTVNHRRQRQLHFCERCRGR